MPRHGPEGNPHKLPAKASSTAKARAKGQQGRRKRRKFPPVNVPHSRSR